MAYIGKSPAQVKRDLASKDSFTGDGSTTTFDLTDIALDANHIQVFVDNVRQEPGTGKSYTLGQDGSGDLKRITFTVAPDNAADIYVINEGTRTHQVTTVSCAAITTAKLADDAVTSAKIVDGAIVNADINASAAIADSKLATITTASKVNVSALSAPGSTSLFLRGDRSYAAIPTDQIDTNTFNISLLGFKMAVNEGLTVFNLIDGVVDEFHDESGTDESEGSNDTYCATSDFYQNATSTPVSAGFTTTSITEPQTSTTGTNPTYGSGTFAQFSTGSSGTLDINVWGAGGGVRSPTGGPNNAGGGGGFASGSYSYTACTTLYVSAGEGGRATAGNCNAFFNGGKKNPSANIPEGNGGGGGGLSGVFTANLVPLSAPQYSAPTAIVVAGSGGAGAYGCTPTPLGTGNVGGAGGGLTGNAGNSVNSQTNYGPAPSVNAHGGGGDQEQGGQAGASESPITAQSGSLFKGGDGSKHYTGSGGAGFYGGGGGGTNAACEGTGGGGSSYYGHPQVTSGSTEAGAWNEGGGTTDPNYVAGTNEGTVLSNGSGCQHIGEDGYVLISGSLLGSATSTTLVSTAFAAGSVPTTSRIVVFEENVDTPTLNTDIIASISRDGGSNYTTATLSDSGYVTGASGQRILTGQATISGQPSGQSMRWKIALANNKVKIHGVSLQWA